MYQRVVHPFTAEGPLSYWRVSALELHGSRQDMVNKTKANAYSSDLSQTVRSAQFGGTSKLTTANGGRNDWRLEQCSFFLRRDRVWGSIRTPRLDGLLVLSLSMCHWSCGVCCQTSAQSVCEHATSAYLTENKTYTVLATSRSVQSSNFSPFHLHHNQTQSGRLRLRVGRGAGSSYANHIRPSRVR